LKGEILSPFPHLEKQRLTAVHIQYPGCFLSRCPVGQATGEQAPGLPVWGRPQIKATDLFGEKPRHERTTASQKHLLAGCFAMTGGTENLHSAP
jgi:hypothetical protein